MDELEKLEMLEAMTGVSDESVLSTYLTLSEGVVLKQLYPYDDTQTEVPDRYATDQLEIAAYMIDKRGAEGETSHSENGVSRTYENGDIPTSLLRRIVPMAGVVSE